MENKRKCPQSHQDRESQKIVKHIEKQRQRPPEKPITKRTLDDYGKKVGN
jgi:hypothetical protein